MANRTDAHHASVRGRILRGARRAFARHGYEGASVPEIAAESGVSVGLIYRYFRSKQELFLELCLPGSGEAYQELELELEGIEDPGLLLRRAFSAWLDAQEDGSARIVLSAWAATEGDPAIRESMRQRSVELTAFADRVAGLVVDRLQRTPSAPVGVGLATKLLLDGVVAQYAIGGKVDRAAILEAMVELVSAALGLGVDEHAHGA